MNTSHCPFCKPDIESISFLSSPNFLVIYNQSPILPGHSLVIPRNHYQSLLDLPLAHSHEMMNLSMHAVRILMDIFNADGFDWTIQDGTSAGQTVPHLHLHLVPRHHGDLPDPGDWYPRLEESQSKYLDSNQRNKYSFTQLQEIVSELKMRIKGSSE